jgi:hypothetical protein
MSHQWQTEGTRYSTAEELGGCQAQKNGRRRQIQTSIATMKECLFAIVGV